MQLCIRDDAQTAMRGLSPVNKDVINIVLDGDHWRQNDQLIRICKPLVDAIGNLESRDTTLADCMLELIAAERAITTIQLKPDDDPAFTQHAQNQVRRRFHEMNTTLHWFALFLHPLARALAISSAPHSRTLKHAYDFAFDVAERWNWSKDTVTKLIQDIGKYHRGEAPFAGGIADARAWWNGLPITHGQCPLKAMAVRIFSIVPHAAEIERLFSDLGGVQSPRRCRLSVPHMETLGILRNHYNGELSGGKTSHRKHAHMHTRDDAGIDVTKLTELTSQWALETGEPTSAVLDPPPPDEISPSEIEQAFSDLGNVARAGGGDGLPESVGVEAVYAVDEMDRIRRGVAPPAAANDVAAHDSGASENRGWS